MSNELFELIKKYKKGEKIDTNNYVFIPLANIEKRNKKIEEISGFLVYSNKFIKKNWFKTEAQVKIQCNKGTTDNVTLKDLRDEKEHYTCRYYYFEKLNNKKNKHITIIMINPAFAYSKKTDRTINNIRKKLKDLKNPENSEFLISSFDIVNISPIRNAYTNAFSMLEINNTKNQYYNKENYQDFLEEILNSADLIVPAWGDTIDKKELQKTNIKKTINKLLINKKVCILKQTVNGNPMHLARINNGKLKNAWNKIIEFLN